MGVLQAGEIRFNPPLPDWKRVAIEALPMGSCNKVVLSFRSDIFCEFKSTVVMPNLGAQAGIEIDIDPERGDLATVLCNGPIAAMLSDQGSDALLDYALDVLAGLFGNEIRQEYSGTHFVADWNAAPSVLGAYTCVKAGRHGARQSLGRPLAARVYFAGEAVSREFAGDVHGAWLSGIQAARDAVAAVRNQAAPGP